MKKIVALVLSLVMVLGLATTAMAAPAAVEFDYWDATTNEWKDAGVTFPAGTDLDDLVADDEEYLPCYEIHGDFYVEVAAASATNKLVYGAKTVYLVEVDEADYKFIDEAKAFTVVDADDATCGDYYIANLDEDDVYYASFNKDGSLKQAYVAKKTATDNILVNGKLVAAETVTVTQETHAWAGYDVANYQYTTVKCQNCGKVATLYANATAAGKGAVRVPATGDLLGYITKADAGFTVAGTAVEGDKVTSAETFDAGIAMYVGMSVMAAAGSAVVLKKKD